MAGLEHADSSRASPEAVLRSAGAVGRDLLAVDWTSTPLGPPSTWQLSLTLALRTMLGSRFAMWMAWGPELTFFCNDAYRRDTLGLKYPWALGRPAREVWAEIWPDIGPRIDSVLETGQATWDEALQLYLERSGYREETYHTFSYSGLADDTGNRLGMLCVVAEETERVVGERRMEALVAIASALSSVQLVSEIGPALQDVMAGQRADLPLTLTYERSGDEHRLMEATGLEDAGCLATDVLAPEWERADRLAASEATVALEELGLRPAASPSGDRPTHAVVVPLPGRGREAPAGLFVAGLNPNRPRDEAYVAFVGLVAGQIASAMGAAHAYEHERRRAEELTELDRAKTAFFTNVSHEFRTPLTLMLAPIADALADVGPTALNEVQRERMLLAQRNGARLLALVNTLLDFNRLQAGRLAPRLEPVDLAAETTDLASMFRSAIESGGLEFDVDCAPLERPVPIDRRMWEQIVTNLISNAFKHTFAGRVAVRLRPHGSDEVELRVEDTGVGIPDEDQQLVFDRFHRVGGTRSRSIEGSGIGLALVRELVDALGGTIRLASTLGQGTTVRVAVPLLAEADAPGEPAPVGDVAAARVAEAQSWVSTAPEAAVEDIPTDDRPVVLVVDDNPDMRGYLSRILQPGYAVLTAGSGREAMSILRNMRADLVLTDVMMPDVDGFELARWVRADSGMADMPIILVSARAGAESAVEGLDLGADDYLVKPFSADELLGRVASRLAAGARRRRRRLLTTLSADLAQADDEQAVARCLRAFAADALGAGNVTIAILADDGASVRYWHGATYGSGIDERYYIGSIDSGLPSSRAIRDNEPVLIEAPDALDDRGAMARDWAVAGVEAEAAVPIPRATGEAAGSLTVVWSRPRRLRRDDLVMLEDVAALTGEAVERIRAGQAARELLDQLQSRLLEVDRRSPVAAACVRYRPADVHIRIGGDWYDIFAPDAGLMGITVGDVVGHGIGAAAVMGQLRSALRMATLREPTPELAVELVDRHARRIPGAFAATLLYLTLDAAGELAYCSAGHLPPLLMSGRSCRYLPTARRPPLATPTDGDDAPVRDRIAPTDLVVAYTDGLVERRGEPLDRGLERLAEAVQACAHLPAGMLCDGVLERMRPPDGYRDDVAMVAARLAGATETRLVDLYPAGPGSLVEARTTLREWLQARDLPAGTVHDVLLAVGEANVNAIEHGTSDSADQLVSTEVSIHEGTLRAAVTDTGRWSGDTTRGPAVGRGRGFMIMNAVMDAVSVDRDRLGTTVNLELRLPEPAATRSR